MEVLNWSCGHEIARGKRIKVVRKPDIIRDGVVLVQVSEKSVDLLRLSTGRSVRIEHVDEQVSKAIIKNWENI